VFSALLEGRRTVENIFSAWLITVNWLCFGRLCCRFVFHRGALYRW